MRGGSQIYKSNQTIKKSASPLKSVIASDFSLKKIDVKLRNKRYSQILLISTNGKV